MNVYELETPSVLIDLDRMQRNIARMQTRCDSLGLKFRPHTKTHKIPEIARMQLDAGAIGIACQKVSEAQLFAEAGFNDIQIPYNIVGAQKAGKLADLALFNKVTVSADDMAVIEGLAAAAKSREMSLRVMVELMTDIERTGAAVDEVVALAQRIEADENLHFAGLLVYPSNPTVRPALQEALHQLHTAGIGVDIVSGGGTKASVHAAEVPELTELRVGTYLFNDFTHVAQEVATLEDCAMHIAATVVSRPTAERAIIDAGSKTLSSDRFGGFFGYIMEYPLARIYQLNEEHGFIDLTACDERPIIGDRLHVVPIHACVVTNLANRIYGVRGTEVETEWTVAARGCVW